MELKVQTMAQWRGRFHGFMDEIDIIVVVTDEGAPVTTLGNDIERQSEHNQGVKIIKLPQGWKLKSVAGLRIWPVSFRNLGDGIYQIRVLYFANIGDLTNEFHFPHEWTVGQIVYVVSIAVPVPVPGHPIRRGSGIGEITIESGWSAPHRPT